MIAMGLLRAMILPAFLYASVGILILAGNSRPWLF
jgi:hypothetical protein